MWRLESARIIAGLARLVRDVGLAEELAQDALVAALEQWPAAGVPANPGGWLMADGQAPGHRPFPPRRTARRASSTSSAASWDAEARCPASSTTSSTSDEIDDDLLRLIFIACHPVLSTEARVALTLRLLGGLTTEEIARAFLVPEPTIAQRIVRAKRALASAQVPFEVPPRASARPRLASVLEVVYLVFNEGYSATAGDDWMRPALCDEALRLGRVLAGLMPAEPEVHGLVALMEIQASRMPARLGPAGRPVLLLEQDRGRWDQLLIRRGFAALVRAERLGGAPGPYVLQAAIAACHARARTAAETDWARIAALYRGLASAHAVAGGRAESRGGGGDGVRSGSAAWTSWTALAAEPALRGLPPGCPACAATCWPNSAVTTRRAASSSGPPRSPGTTPNGPSFCSAPPNATRVPDRSGRQSLRPGSWSGCQDADA